MATLGPDLSGNELQEHYFNPKTADEEEVASKKFLINKLNYVNFQEKIISCNFVNRQDNSRVSVDIKPEPCIGNYLVGLWPKDADMGTIIDRCGFRQLVVPDGTRNIIVEPDVRYINNNGFCLSLPETCTLTPSGSYELNNWSLMDTMICQDELELSASLIDFNAHSIVLSIEMAEANRLKMIRREKKIRIRFLKEGEAIFDNWYNLVQSAPGTEYISVILKPVTTSLPVRVAKRNRNRRYSLNPAPEVSFKHPFNARLSNMKVTDISASGFSVEAVTGGSLLITGMTINDLELNFAGLLKLRCDVKVVHQTIEKDDQGHRVKFGLAIVNISLDDHMILLELLNQVENKHLKICARINPDELWDFFFESGFIYQKKYRMFLENKKGIRKTYGKLYMEKATISRHFTCHEQDQLIGHMSTLWFGKNSWLIHHHAALKGWGVKAGLEVLNLMAQFIINVEWLEKYHMRYLFCYFRPDNLFPNYFFSGFTDKLNDPGKSSTDIFAYSYFKKSLSEQTTLPDGWRLAEAEQIDLDTLKRFYERVSNGLLLKALGVENIEEKPSLVETTYKKAGLKREMGLWALKHRNNLKAVFIVSLSDFGLNMSDLTNCISMLVIDSEGLDKGVVELILNRLAVYFEQKKFPVLYYPAGFADEQGIEYQKHYKMWALNLEASDDYIDFLEEINRMSREKVK